MMTEASQDNPPGGLGRSCRAGVLILVIAMAFSLEGARSLGQTRPSEPAGEPGTGEVPASTQPETPNQDTTFYATATVVERPLASATGAVSTVSSERLEALAALEVSEALDFIPGVFLNRGSRGGLTTAQIRGGDPNFTLVLLDGVPLNDGTDSFGGAFALASVPVIGLERVEVVRAPLSSFYGSSALAGAVHLITRSAKERRHLEAELEAGEHELVHGGLALGGIAASRRDAFLALSGDQESGRVGEDAFEQWAGLGNVGLPLGTGRELALHGRYADWAAEDYPDGSGGPTLGSGELRTSDHREASLGLLADLGAERWRHQARGSYYRHDQRRTSPAIEPVVPPSIEDTEYSRVRLGFTATRGFERSPFGNVSFGAELEREAGENSSLLLLPDSLGGPTPGDYDLERDLGAFLVEAVWQSGGGEGGTTLEIGARLDLPEAASEQASPRLGVRHRFGQGPASLRASVGRAFKLPSFFALGSPPALGGNPELEPETSVGGDLGLQLDLERLDLELGLSLFRSRFRDLIDFDFETFALVNRSQVDAEGIEASWLWSPGPRLELRGQGTWQEVEDRDSGLELRRRPDWFAAASLALRPLERLHLLFDARAAGDAVDEQVPIGGRATLDGYELFGLSALWDLGSSWQLRLRADNLTDEAYETQIGFPGPGLSLRGGVRYRIRAAQGRQDVAAVSEP